MYEFLMFSYQLSDYSKYKIRNKYLYLCDSTYPLCRE